MEVNDYSAELIVASTFAEAGWNVYFPHRDKGFDFIISKEVDGEEIIRPVQVKGKYPTEEKGDKATYGYMGKLTKLHPEMVLAMPFYSSEASSLPLFIAYIPKSLVKECSKGYKCHPATFKDGNPKKRRDYAKFFDKEGINLLERLDWKDSKVI